MVYILSTATLHIRRKPQLGAGILIASCLGTGGLSTFLYYLERPGGPNLNVPQDQGRVRHESMVNLCKEIQGSLLPSSWAPRTFLLFCDFFYLFFVFSASCHEEIFDTGVSFSFFFSVWVSNRVMGMVIELEQVIIVLNFFCCLTNTGIGVGLGPFFIRMF